MYKEEYANSVGRRPQPTEPHTERIMLPVGEGDIAGFISPGLDVFRVPVSPAYRRPPRARAALEASI